MSLTTETRRLAVALTGAFLAAAVTLFAFVLPAEYGYDPLGTGAALGLNALSSQESQALVSAHNKLQTDSITFELAPFEAVEYKYRLAGGETLLFEWQANTELLFDFHAEPDGAAPGFAQSFEKSRSKGEAGSYTAPFAGIHGWFWQNRTEEKASLTLRSCGFFSDAFEMRDGHTFKYHVESSGRRISDSD